MVRPGSGSLQFGHEFVGAVEAGKGLGQLRADGDDLKDRRVMKTRNML